MTGAIQKPKAAPEVSNIVRIEEAQAQAPAVRSMTSSVQSQKQAERMAQAVVPAMPTPQRLRGGSYLPSMMEGEWGGRSDEEDLYGYYRRGRRKWKIGKAESVLKNLI
jgi:hypothetical protein